MFIDIVSMNLRNVTSIAIMTIIFAIFLYIADMKKTVAISSLKSLSIFTIIFIGIMQTLAIIPGVSRSGIVITAALLAGFSRKDSIQIAFLLSIPAIFMATVYQSFGLYKLGSIEILNEYVWGAFYLLFFHI